MSKEQRMRESLGFDEYHKTLLDNASMQNLHYIDSVEDADVSDEALESMEQWESENLHTADEVWGVIWEMVTQAKTDEEIDLYLDMNDSWSGLIGDYYTTTAEAMVKMTPEEMQENLH